MASLGKRRRAPVVFLDEVDVIQMADAALEWSRESFGLLHGSVRRRKGRDEFHITYVQVLQGGRRTRTQLSYSDRSFQKLLRQYPDIIGDFHSHVGATQADYPSHRDIEDIIRVYPEGRHLFAIIHVAKETRKDAGREEVNELIRRRGKIIYRFYDAVVTIRFYMLRDGIGACRRNMRARDHVRLVLPRCRIRYKFNEKYLRIS